MSLKFVHHELKASEVPNDVRARIEVASVLAARMLDLPRLRVRYFAVVPSLDAKAQGDVLLEQLGHALGVLGPSDYDLEDNGYRETKSWLDTGVELGLALRAEPTTIYINPLPDDPFKLVHVVLHEARHRWQYARFDEEWGKRPPKDWEADAESWAKAHTLEVAAHLEAIYQTVMARMPGR